MKRVFELNLNQHIDAAQSITLSLIVFIAYSYASISHAHIQYAYTQTHTLSHSILRSQVGPFIYFPCPVVSSVPLEEVD